MVVAGLETARPHEVWEQPNLGAGGEAGMGIAELGMGLGVLVVLIGFAVLLVYGATRKS